MNENINLLRWFCDKTILRTFWILYNRNVFFLGFNMELLTSRCGLLKIFEVVLGSCCETLLIRFGMPAAQDIGEKSFNWLFPLNGNFSCTCCYQFKSCACMSDILEWNVSPINYFEQFSSFFRRSILQLPLDCLRLPDDHIDSPGLVLFQHENLRFNAAICLRKSASPLQFDELPLTLLSLQEIFFNAFACFLYISTRWATPFNH